MQIIIICFFLKFSIDKATLDTVIRDLLCFWAFFKLVFNIEQRMRFTNSILTIDIFFRLTSHHVTLSDILYNFLINFYFSEICFTIFAIDSKIYGKVWSSILQTKPFVQGCSHCFASYALVVYWTTRNSIASCSSLSTSTSPSPRASMTIPSSYDPLDHLYMFADPNNAYRPSRVSAM